MSYWTTAILGSTNKFFMPWLVPRNDKGSVYAPNFLGKLFGAGRKRRDLAEGELDALKGIYDLDMSNVIFCHDENVVCLKSAAIDAHQKFVKFQSRKYELSSDAFENVLDFESSRCKEIYNECLRKSTKN